MKECAEQLDRGGIGPVHVVQDERHGLPLAEQLQERADSTMAAIAFVLDRDLAAVRESGERRKDRCELGSDAVLEHLELSGLQRVEVLIESVDEDPERDVSLELARTTG